jgi:hypothetical protein
MATFNFTSSTNNANVVLWSFGTKLEKHSDRDAVSTARGGLISAVNNLGTGVAAGEPFTILG